MTPLEQVNHRTLKTGYQANKHGFRKVVQQITKAVEYPIWVNVGANDGVTNDLCSDLIRGSEKWTGLLIEPVPYLFEKLQANYPAERFLFENIAIGCKPGSAPLFYLGPDAREAHELPDWVEGLGSFNRDHLDRHLARADGALDPFIRERLVPVDTLARVVTKHGLTHITLLQIDTEGHDYDVLKSLNAVIAPALICIEHEHLSMADKEQMLDGLVKDYDVFDLGSDYAAIRHGTFQ